MYLLAVVMDLSGRESQPSPVGPGVGFPLKNDIVSSFTGSEGSAGNPEGGGGLVILRQGCSAGLRMGLAEAGRGPELGQGL